MPADDQATSLFDTIIDQLGGTSMAAKALGRRPSQICQWRAKDGRFPAEMYWKVQDALKQRSNDTQVCPHCGGVVPKPSRQKKSPPDLPQLPRELFRFEDERTAG